MPTPEHDHGGSNWDCSDKPLWVSFPSSSASHHTSHHHSLLSSLSQLSLPSFSSSPSPAGTDSDKCTCSHLPSHAPHCKWPDQSNHSQPSTAQQHGAAQPSTATEQPGAAPPPPKLKPLWWLNDQAPTGRLKAHDYNHNICQLMVQSCHKFSACVYTQEALPDPKMQIYWSCEIWEATCKVVDENYECSDNVIGLVSIQLYHLYICGNIPEQIRTQISNAVWPKISSHFGLTHTMKAKGKITTCNKKICESLLENNAFHYKVWDSALGWSNAYDIF